MNRRPLQPGPQGAGPLGPILIAVALAIAVAGGYFVLGRGGDQARDERVELDRDNQFREFLTKAHLKKNQLPDLDAWNRWLLSEGHKPCVTCNGAGKAGGAGCRHCSGFGVEPRAAR